MEEEPSPENEAEAVLALFGKKQTDISMQVEEIYDMLQDDGSLREALKGEKKRSSKLLDAVIGLCDVIEDFCVFAAEGGDAELTKQALLMRRAATKYLESCGMTMINEPGESGFPFDPKIHEVQAVTGSDYPKDSVVEVLRSGYGNRGETARKAAVIVSSGAPGETEENQ
jgi:molecular chaperone GrpE (heat shock protein)